MRFDVVSLFPEMFEGFLSTSIVGRARKADALSVRLESPRGHGLGRHQIVDDTPYGGGSGMVLRADVVLATMESLDASAPGGVRARRILLSPQGAVFNQGHARRLSAEPALMLICGRYEGFDDRIGPYVDEELSIGDFVLTGGELAAMVIIDACARLLPGVLGNETSAEDESHSPLSGGLLEYPHYTRPAEFRGVGVPEVLVSGHHGAVAAWRRAMALERTRLRRPDLYQRYQQTLLANIAEAMAGDSGEGAT